MNRNRILSVLSFLVFSVSIIAQPDYTVPRISPIPTEVSGVENIRMDLDGTWKFNPVFENDYIRIKSNPSWSDIKVPGEWSMQGFRVDSGHAAAYFRIFDIPTDWKDKRVKIRFNGVYSKSVIYINGKEAGSHHGGFTAFELDITDLIDYKNENSLLLSVTSESLADSLASGSKYACHPLGGIPRSVCVFPLPKNNISSLFVNTDLDDNYENATLKTIVEISNEGNRSSDDLSLTLELKYPEGSETISEELSPLSLNKLNKEESKITAVSYDVAMPLKWDCENPHLYTLIIKLLKGGKHLETIEQKIGFREVEVKGNQLFVNGMPVKLRGVNRHEVYPLTGRSIPKEMYRKDVEIFREGNVNHIRTCHYPPDQALMEAADELGMFIECEGPFCWSHQTKGDSTAIREITIKQLEEMIVLYRNHPSIIFWSIGNESLWNEDYRLAGERMKEMDPTRPITFNYYPWGWVNNKQEDESVCAIGSDHYPSPKGPGKYADYRRPISFGEFVHLNAYNRYELATDVALRDKWGIYLHDMWEDMYESQGVAGGSIWAGIDDTFYWDYVNPDGSIEERTVGYGTWGPIDGWRRKKPEWWGMKKTYSPIRISNVEGIYNKVRFEVENRQDFSNLSRLTLKWKIGYDSGILNPDIPPKETGLLEIQSMQAIESGAKLELEFLDPRGFMVDTFSFDIYPETIQPEIKTRYITGPDQTSISLEVKEDNIIIRRNYERYIISSSTGLFANHEFKGPYLMILPLNNGGDTQMHGPTKYYEPYTHTCTDWKLEKLETSKIDGIHYVIAKGSYKEAEGSFVYKFNFDGSVTVDYDFTLKEDVNPRQMGIVFDMPKGEKSDLNPTLFWKRKGYWSTYPDWHIARLEGHARPEEGFEATPVGPRTKPSHEWRYDMTAIGSNDFASTKHNIIEASVQDWVGNSLKVYGNGILHARSWVDGEKIRWLIANYSNGGSERFLRPHADKDDIYLKKGDSVKGSVKLRYNNTL